MPMTSPGLSPALLGAPNGIAQLDGTTKIPLAELPINSRQFKGAWNASTNTPSLTNGVGTAGDEYVCTVAGSANFGAGAVAFIVGDCVAYNGTGWEKVPAEYPVVEVNGKVGVVDLQAADVGALASPPGGGASNVVGWNLGGTYTAVPYSQGTTGFGLVMRDIDGQIACITPTAASHAASKGYVDGLLFTKWSQNGSDALVPAIGDAQDIGTSNLTVRHVWAENVMTPPIEITSGGTFKDSDPEEIYIDATAGALEAQIDMGATSVGKGFLFKKTDASANAVTVTLNGGGTIEGAASVVLSTRYQWVRLRIVSATLAYIIGKG